MHVVLSVLRHICSQYLSIEVYALSIICFETYAVSITSIEVYDLSIICFETYMLPLEASMCAQVMSERLYLQDECTLMPRQCH